MAFRDSFHEVVPGYRINGDALVFVIKGTKTGGPGAGAKTLEVGNIGVASHNFVETDDPANWPIPDSYLPVTDIDQVYEQLELAGLSTVVDGVLVNPSNVSLLEYTNDRLIADAAGGGGKFVFSRSNKTYWERNGFKFSVPTAEFDNFKTLALQRLTTALEVVGQASNAYIHFDGSNDYVEFTAKGAANANLLDWTGEWTIGMTLTEFEVKSDQKFFTLFSSGSNAIMLRRGAANHGLYVTGNNGVTKIGANTWHAPNAGGKVLFTYADNRLKYYIGNVDGSYALRANYLVNVANIGGNTPGDNFCVGKRVTSNNVGESLMFHGGANNLIVAAEALGGPLVEEYFGVNEVYDESSFYADLTSWAKMGEDPYPNVVDQKGAMTGGELLYGTEDDFVEIPE